MIMALAKLQSQDVHLLHMERVLLNRINETRICVINANGHFILVYLSFGIQWSCWGYRKWIYYYMSQIKTRRSNSTSSSVQSGSAKSPTTVANYWPGVHTTAFSDPSAFLCKHGSASTHYVYTAYTHTHINKHTHTLPGEVVDGRSRSIILMKKCLIQYTKPTWTQLHFLLMEIKESRSNLSSSYFTTVYNYITLWVRLCVCVYKRLCVCEKERDLIFRTTINWDDRYNTLFDSAFHR